MPVSGGSAGIGREFRVDAVAETAIVVVVPEADPAVGAVYRARTRAGRQGMPPHVTLLIPFANSESLPLAEVRTVLQTFEPFEFELTQTRRFEPPSELILWLVPEPAARFVAMTEALVRAFPEYQPYGGVFDDVVPHLSVAVSRDARVIEQIEREITQALPIAARAEAASIVQRADGRWRPHTTIPFSGD
jgi:hypothetical protein